MFLLRTWMSVHDYAVVPDILGYTVCILFLVWQQTLQERGCAVSLFQNKGAQFTEFNNLKTLE